MSEEEINVAIAECCGWDTDPVEAHPWTSRGQWVIKPWDGKRELYSKIMNMPNYCGDLNAMHEAEKLLRPPFWKDYSIWQIYIDHFEEDPHATAAQRAEAFLRTLGKWRE